MKVPNYTELTNYEIRRKGKKVSVDLSIIIFNDRFTDSKVTLKSVEDFLNENDTDTEVILISLDRENSLQDEVLTSFSKARIFLPEKTFNYRDAFYLAVEESASKNLLFIDHHFQIRSIPLDLLDTYLSEYNFGMLVPLIYSSSNPDLSIANLIRGSIHKGFLVTESVQSGRTSVKSLYPKYHCFILNKEAFLNSEVNFLEYDNHQYNLLELGFELWNHGYSVRQSRNFKMLYDHNAEDDIVFSPNDKDFNLFNLSRFSNTPYEKEQRKVLMMEKIRWIFKMNFKMVSEINKALKMADSFKNFKYQNREQNTSDLLKQISEDVE